MTSEELLKPRWRVIADYPNCPWNIGRILTCLNNEWDCLDAPTSQKVRNIENYPAIFKKLEWWEDRSIEELPEYLQETIDSKQVVYQVFEYDLWQGIVLIEDSPEVLYLENLQPSTKEEYEKTNN